MNPSAPRLILVGAGRMGMHHLGAARRAGHLRLVGILERDASRCRSLESQHGIPASTDLGALVAAVRPDCAIVATPDATHVEIALACLAHGLHALVEKPLAPSHAEALLLVDRFRHEGRILAGGMVERHNPAWGVFRRHADLAGTPVSLDIRRSGRLPHERGSGVLRDLAIHDVDLLLAWLGDVVLARIGEDAGPLHSAELAAAAPFAIRLRAGWGDAPPVRTWSLQGSLGRLELDLAARTVRFVPVGGPSRALPVAERDALEAEHEEFAGILRGRLGSDRLALPRQLEALRRCATPGDPSSATPMHPPGSPGRARPAASASAPARRSPVPLPPS